jgi:hypothetical protein
MSLLGAEIIAPIYVIMVVQPCSSLLRMHGFPIYFRISGPAAAHLAKLKC